MVEAKAKKLQASIKCKIASIFYRIKALKKRVKFAPYGGSKSKKASSFYLRNELKFKNASPITQGSSTKGNSAKYHNA